MGMHMDVNVKMFASMNIENMEMSSLPEYHAEKGCCYYQQAGSDFDDMFITYNHIKE